MPILMGLKDPTAIVELLTLATLILAFSALVGLMFLFLSYRRLNKKVYCALVLAEEVMKDVSLVFGALLTSDDNFSEEYRSWLFLSEKQGSLREDLHFFIIGHHPGTNDQVN
jgi:hypothetical protein